MVYGIVVGNNPVNFIDPKGLEIFVVGRGPFYFRHLPRITRMPRHVPPRACRTTRPTPAPDPVPTDWTPPGVEDLVNSGRQNLLDRIGDFMEGLQDLDSLGGSGGTTVTSPDPYGGLLGDLST